MFMFKQKNRTNASLWFVLLAIIFLPLFKGGNYPGVMAVFLFLMVGVFLLSFADERNQKPDAWLIVWIVVSVAVAVHAFVFPLVLSNERFFDGGLDSRVSSFLGSASLSNIRLLEVWAYFTAMWLFVWRISIASRAEVTILLTSLFFVSSFQAIYGIFHLVSGDTSVLGLWTKEYYIGDATGTFVNRNHFSGMLAIASPLVLSGLLVSQPFIFSRFSRASRLFVASMYSMFILLALITAHSRMGLLAGMLGFFVFLFLLLKPGGHRGGAPKFSRWKLILGIFVFMLLFATWFGFADILYRYAQLGDGNSRLDVWRALLSMPLHVWFFGVGPGQFEDIFQIVKPSYFSVRFIYAHNDYLEFIFEFGLLWSAIIFLACIFWFKGLGIARGRHLLQSGVLGAISALGLHSLVDFNLQVPASALCFCLALGLFVNPAMRSDVDAGDAGSSDKRKVRYGKRSRWPQNKREWLDFFRSE